MNGLHGVDVVRGSNQPEGEQNGRATMGTSPVGFDHTPFGAACGRCGFPHGITGEGLEALRCIGKPLILEGFGCADSVGVVGFDFHNFKRASIARRTHAFAWARRGIQAWDSMK